MPRDADFGRDLAARIMAASSGNVSNVEFTYDAYTDLDRIGETDHYCCISPNLYDHTRETRNHWRETIQLVLTLVSSVGPTNDSQWVDDWLDSWDALVRETREMPLFDKHKPTSVETDARYDTDLFHNSNRLVTQAMINYLNVKVM